MIPLPELDPKKVSTWTLKANICTTGRQRGMDWCREKCDAPCKWAAELATRQGLPPKKKPEPERFVNYVKTAKKHPAPTRKRRIIGRIPYLTAWLRDLKDTGHFDTWMELAERSGLTRSRMSKAINEDRWTRDFETKVIAGLEMTETEAVTLILRWAHDNGLEGDAK